VYRVRADLYVRIIATQLQQGTGGAPMRDPQGVSRRHVLGMAIAAGGFTVSGGEILGPFYPVLRSVEKTHPPKNDRFGIGAHDRPPGADDDASGPGGAP
jgi:hypothetical protein